MALRIAQRLFFLILFLAPVAAQAEYRRIELTIFGMD